MPLSTSCPTGGATMSFDWSKDLTLGVRAYPTIALATVRGAGWTPPTFQTLDLYDEEGRRNKRSHNVRVLYHNKEAEERLARQDEAAREQARKRQRTVGSYH